MIPIQSKTLHNIYSASTYVKLEGHSLKSILLKRTRIFVQVCEAECCHQCESQTQRGWRVCRGSDQNSNVSNILNQCFVQICLSKFQVPFMPLSAMEALTTGQYYPVPALVCIISSIQKYYTGGSTIQYLHWSVAN